MVHVKKLFIREGSRLVHMVFWNYSQFLVKNIFFVENFTKAFFGIFLPVIHIFFGNLVKNAILLAQLFPNIRKTVTDCFWLDAKISKHSHEHVAYCK